LHESRLLLPWCAKAIPSVRSADFDKVLHAGLWISSTSQDTPIHLWATWAYMHVGGEWQLVQ
jgi:hypothetical protein